MYFQKIFLYFILLFSFCSQQTVYAWNGFYHRVIAQIAYDQLNLQQKRQINAWLNPPNSKIKMRFLTASIWPDYIKARGNKTFNDWHFINLPFIQDAMIAKAIGLNKLSVEIFNLREFSDNPYKSVDDKPFGIDTYILKPLTKKPGVVTMYQIVFSKQYHNKISIHC